jgi:hypothetical protein
MKQINADQKCRMGLLRFLRHGVISRLLKVALEEQWRQAGVVPTIKPPRFDNDKN